MWGRPAIGLRNREKHHRSGCRAWEFVRSRYATWRGFPSGCIRSLATRIGLKRKRTVAVVAHVTIAHETEQKQDDVPMAEGVAYNIGPLKSAQKEMIEAPTQRQQTSLTWIALVVLAVGQGQPGYLLGVLWDSCCNRAFISDKLYEKLAKSGHVRASRGFMEPRYCSGSCGGRSRIKGWCILWLDFNGKRLPWCFEIVENLGVEMMIGCRNQIQDTLQLRIPSSEGGQ